MKSVFVVLTIVVVVLTMADLATLKRVRGGHRSWLTRNLNTAERLLKSTAITPDLLIEIETIRDALRDKVKKLQIMDDKITPLVEPADLDEEINDAAENEAKGNAVVIKLCQFLDKHRITKTKPELPKITLKPFSGKQEDFLPFWDLFNSTVNSNPNLSNVEKFAYLRHLLQDEAERATAGIRQSDDNYGVLVNTLKERFGKNERSEDFHLNAFLTLDRLTKANDIKALRRQHDIIHQHICSLRSLGVAEDSYSKMAIRLVIKSLPKLVGIKLTEAMRPPVGEEKLPNLMKAFISYIDVNERCSSITDETESEGGKHESNKSYGTRQRPHDNVRSVYVANQSKANCILCCGNHSSEKCQRYRTKDERVQQLRNLRCCFNCGKTSNPPHAARFCRSNQRCTFCNGKHHSCLHDFNARGRQFSTVATEQPAQQNAQNAENSTAKPIVIKTANVHSNSIALQTATAIASNPRTNKSCKVRIMLDSACMLTVATQKLTDFLELPQVGEEVFSVSVFGTPDTQETKCPRVSLRLSKNDFSKDMFAYTSDHVCNKLPPVNVTPQLRDDLSNINLADPQIMTGAHLEVDLLVGLDYYHDIMSVGNEVKLSSGPICKSTPLGCVISGSVTDETKHVCMCNVESPKPVAINYLMVNSLSDNYPMNDIVNLESKLGQFWDQESLGILPNEQEIVHSNFNNTLMYDPVTCMYECELPFKQNIFTQLHDNYDIAVARLDSMLRRLKTISEGKAISENDPPHFQNVDSPSSVTASSSTKSGQPSNSSHTDFDIGSEYQKIFDQQLLEGKIERVLEDVKVGKGSANVQEIDHYIPHKYVLKDTDQGPKLRIVYDGSCKSNKNRLSLNDVLYTGPNLVPELVKVLIRFRMYPVAINADIKSAYLNVSIAPKHRDALRFVWRKNGDLSEPLEIFRSTRACFGLTSSPMCLAATLLSHFEKFGDKFPVASKMINSIYVDDILRGEFSVNDACEFFVQAIELLNLAHMPLHKLTSNSQRVRDFLKDQGLESDFPEVIKLLGLKWNIIDDSLAPDLNVFTETQIQDSYTKCEVLSVIASLYDPLGIFAPYTVQSKIIFQQLCIGKLKWNEQIPQDLYVKFVEWLKGFVILQQSPTCNLPRFIFKVQNEVQGGGKLPGDDGWQG